MNGPIHNKSMEMLFPVQDLSVKMMIKSSNRYCLFEFEQIQFLKGCGSYTWIYTRESDYHVLISISLKNAIYTLVWCTLISQLLLTVSQKIAQAKKAYSVAASLIRIHLISMLDLYEQLRSTKRLIKSRSIPPGLQKSLNMQGVNFKNLKRTIESQIHIEFSCESKR